MLLIPVKDLAVGDYVETFGTIKSITDHSNKDGEVTTRDLYFWNAAYQQMGVSIRDELMVTQGGFFPDPAKGSVREGLAADHSNE